MQVFKAYGYVIYKNLLGICVYIGVFALISILITLSVDTSTSFSFEGTKIPISIINRGEESELVSEFTEFLEDYAIIKTIEDDEEAIADALFVRSIEYFIIVPDGFTATNGMQLEVRAVENSTSTYQMNMIVDKYFNMVNLFANSDTSQVTEMLSKTVDVEIKADVDAGDTHFIAYFNYLPYVLLATTIIGISTVMVILNDKNIRRRNICAPIKLSGINAQISLGNFCLGVAIWIIMVSVGIIINVGTIEINEQFITVILNSFILLIVSISIAFLAGSITNSKDAQMGISNIVSLGSSFIGGVFVPQELLGDTVNTFAMFTPVHWYIKANNLVLEGESLINSTEVMQAMGIQLVFALTFFILAITASKVKAEEA